MQPSRQTWVKSDLSHNGDYMDNYSFGVIIMLYLVAGTSAIAKPCISESDFERKLQADGQVVIGTSTYGDVKADRYVVTHAKSGLSGYYWNKQKDGRFCLVSSIDKVEKQVSIATAAIPSCSSAKSGREAEVCEKLREKGLNPPSVFYHALSSNSVMESTTTGPTKLEYALCADQKSARMVLCVVAETTGD